MAQLGVGEVGIELEARQGKSIIANEGREDALRRHIVSLEVLRSGSSQHTANNSPKLSSTRSAHSSALYCSPRSQLLNQNNKYKTKLGGIYKIAYLRRHLPRLPIILTKFNALWKGERSSEDGHWQYTSDQEYNTDQKEKGKEKTRERPRGIRLNHTSPRTVIFFLFLSHARPPLTCAESPDAPSGDPEAQETPVPPALAIPANQEGSNQKVPGILKLFRRPSFPTRSLQYSALPPPSALPLPHQQLLLSPFGFSQSLPLIFYLHIPHMR